MPREIVVRVNGTIPALSDIGESNPRAHEVESNPAMNVNTSCSLIVNDDGKPVKHILVDAGSGVSGSVKQQCDGGLLAGRCSIDAVLLTHSHADRIDDLPSLAKDFGSIHVYSTRECWDAVARKFPNISVQHTTVEAGKAFEIDGIRITPVAVRHGNEAEPVAYAAEVEGKKVIFAWDASSFVNKNDPLLMGADLLIIDAFTYNPHQETGHLSVLEDYELIKRWNPKEAYMINYSGYQDFKNEENPYARVPKRPLTSEELSSQVTGDVSAWGTGWIERVKVAPHGMVWYSTKKMEMMSPQFMENEVRIFTEGNYAFVIRKAGKGLDVTAETQVVDINYEIIKFNVTQDGRKLTGYTKGGFIAKPTEMVLEINDAADPAIVKIRIAGGKITTYNRDISLKKSDAEKLREFLMRLK